MKVTTQRTEVTTQQLFDHYLDAGMPEVYAAMAADENLYRYIKSKASLTLRSSFIWDNSVLGHHFWFGIFSELEHANH